MYKIFIFLFKIKYSFFIKNKKYSLHTLITHLVANIVFY